MGHVSSNSHIPYAIRLMARLQEQAAQSSVQGVQADRLEKCAGHLRVTARSLDCNNPGLTYPIPELMTQKVKLLHFLRQQK